MEVITIESSAFQELKVMFAESQEAIKRQAEIIDRSKIGLMDVKQVAELTGYSEQTIKARKQEIGYSTLGKDLRFKPSDVQNWINKYYKSPRSK